MDIAFSIEMVIWVAVGGRASLVGAVVGALLVNFGKSLLSEQFPEVWLFFQGALFLIVVMVLPNGLVGWLRFQGWEMFQKLLVEIGMLLPILVWKKIQKYNVKEKSWRSVNC